MSKEIEWYLIYQDEHLGPYSEANLMELYDSKELAADSLIWCEGQDESCEFQSVFLSQKISKEFVSLASQSEVVEIDTPPDLPISEVLNQEEEIVPPPLDFLKKSESDIDLVEYEDEVPPLPIANEVKESTKKKKLKFWPWKGACLIFLVLFFGLKYFPSFEQDFSRPAGLSIKEYNRLLNTAHSKGEKNVFAFSLSPDKKTIWISTNIDLSGYVNFNFRNEEHDNLGDEVVEVQGKVELYNHLMEIKNFDFIQGSKFIDGIYDIELFTSEDLEAPLIKRYFTKKEKQFKYQGTKLISTLSEEKFYAALLNRKKSESKNEIEFFETLAEEYRTVQMITNQILVAAKSVFEAGELTRTQAYNNFEKGYKTNYGVFFTSFIISVDKKYELISQKEFADKVEVIAHYTKLKNIALTIGEESVEQLRQIKQIDWTNLSETEIKELEFRSTLKFKEIIVECETMINELKGIQPNI